MHIEHYLIQFFTTRSFTKDRLGVLFYAISSYVTVYTTLPDRFATR